ncbi:hypothetical protein AB0D34_04695 [Streptomyces sp. NPDC048420]|uniref:hypothetical protein n=1 Tax=Streptomyces sp. NPDC048420 TaxID=3155755 RepID=UPI003416D0E1
MSPARRLPPSRTWLRTLVLLLALLVPVAPVHAAEAHVVAAGEIIEYDLLDTALRPPARVVHQPAVSLRPAPRQETCPRAHRPPRPSRPPYAPPAPRSVVLRC